LAYKKTLYKVAKDRFIRGAIDRTVVNYRINRKEVFSMFPGIEEKAQKLRRIREEVLEDLSYYVDMAGRMIERHGGYVYYAKDGREARRIIGDICDGRMVVKSKSLTTEEIKLNEYLEKRGCEVWETDLGEFIVQLAKSRPMHYVTPSIHIPIDRVAKLFSELAGRGMPLDVNELVRFAREFLRDKFFRADVGITGANVVVAETGSIFLVENEGNIRFVSNSPPVHVVVAGIEKIVPKLEHGIMYVDVLAKYAGYIAPGYVSIISGVSKTGDIEKIVVRGAHGPKELHVVFLDNGRSRMLNDEDFKEALLCMRCGSCLYECPVYEIVCGYFGDYYFGGIGTIYMAFIDNIEKVVPMAYTCMMCGRCREVCPMKIDIPTMMLKLRKRIADRGLIPRKLLEAVERTKKYGSPYASS